MSESKQLPELDALSTQLGELIHNWGFKRIHGRIWSRLFLSTRPLDAADLIEQLDISKALVSISLRELLDLKAVQEAGRSDRGTNLFRANQDLNAIYLEVLKQRERRMLKTTHATLASLSSIDSATLTMACVSTAQINVLDGHLKSALTLLNAFVSAAEPQVIPLNSDSREMMEQRSFAASATSASASASAAQYVMVLPAHGG